MRDSLLDGPPVHPFVECPNCHELLELNATLCPHCREEINEEYAIVSALIVHHNTQAVSFANSITAADAFIPLALIGTVAVYGIDWFVWWSSTSLNRSVVLARNAVDRNRSLVFAFWKISDRRRRIYAVAARNASLVCILASFPDR